MGKIIVILLIVAVFLLPLLVYFDGSFAAYFTAIWTFLSLDLIDWFGTIWATVRLYPHIMFIIAWAMVLWGIHFVISFIKKKAGHK